MSELTIKQLQEIILKQAKEKGFGATPEQISVPEKIALIHTEISEAYEAYRKKKINGRHGFKEELTDAIQRIFHLASVFNIDIEKEITKKLKINKKRQWNKSKFNENLLK